MIGYYMRILSPARRCHLQDVVTCRQTWQYILQTSLCYQVCEAHFPNQGHNFITQHCKAVFHSETSGIITIFPEGIRMNQSQLQCTGCHNVQNMQTRIPLLIIFSRLALVSSISQLLGQGKGQDNMGVCKRALQGCITDSCKNSMN